MSQLHILQNNTMHFLSIVLQIYKEILAINYKVFLLYTAVYILLLGHASYSQSNNTENFIYGQQYRNHPTIGEITEMLALRMKTFSLFNLCHFDKPKEKMPSNFNTHSSFLIAAISYLHWNENSEAQRSTTKKADLAGDTI